MKRASLRTKLLLSAGLIVFVILATSTFIHIQDVRQNYLELIEGRSEGLAYVISTELFDKYKNVPKIDDTVLASLSIQCIKLYALSKQNDVTHIAVMNANGLIAAHNDNTFWGTSVEIQELLEQLQLRRQVTLLDGDIYHTLIPMVAEDGMYLGTVDIGYPKQVVDGKVQNLLLRSGVLLSIFLLLTFVSLSRVLYLLLTKPIRELIAVGQKISHGELDQMISSVQNITGSHVVSKDSEDEIQILNGVFHEMVTYLQAMAQSATQIASGDLTQELAIQSENDVLSAYPKLITYFVP